MKIKPNIITTIGECEIEDYIKILEGSCKDKQGIILDKYSNNHKMAKIHIDGRDRLNLVCKVNKCEILNYKSESFNSKEIKNDISGS